MFKTKVQKCYMGTWAENKGWLRSLAWDRCFVQSHVHSHNPYKRRAPPPFVHKAFGMMCHTENSLTLM